MCVFADANVNLDAATTCASTWGRLKNKNDELLSAAFAQQKAYHYLLFLLFIILNKCI